MEKDSLYLSTATGDRMFAFTPRIKLTRQRKTVDIVKRLGVITANRIRLRKYPVENPITAFNPALTVEDHDVIIYARVTLGYYTYASAVAEIIIPLKEFQELSGVYTATGLPGQQVRHLGGGGPQGLQDRGTETDDLFRQDSQLL